MKDDPETVMLATETGVLLIADTATETLLHGEVSVFFKGLNK
jgi:hypothetical protein